MGGISGHAGLFANASDLAVLVHCYEPWYGNNYVFQRRTFTTKLSSQRHQRHLRFGLRRKGHITISGFSPIATLQPLAITVADRHAYRHRRLQQHQLAPLTNTKNSPVIDNSVNPNDFVGNYLTGGYGGCFYAGIRWPRRANAEGNNAKLMDMVIAKYKLIQAEADYQTDPEAAS